MISYKNCSRRMLSVLISHHSNPAFEGCLADQYGKDIYTFGASVLQADL
jgi:hypothetical protein